jgi:predicted MFS family arabinose efflux permease
MATAARETVRRLRGDGRGWIIFAVALGWLLILGGRFLVPALLPQVKAAFDVGNTGGGVAVTLLWATYALMQSPAGVLTDRLGERWLLAGALAGSALSVVLLGLSPTFLVFLAACAFFGFAAGMFGPARGMIMTRVFADDNTAAIALTLAAGSIGSASLPFVAGSIVGDVSWRLIVAALAAPYAVAAGFAWWAIPGREGGPRPDDDIDGETRAAIVRALRIPGISTAMVAHTCMLFVYQGLTAFYVTYFVDVGGFDQGLVALLFATMFLAGSATQVTGGFIANTIGARRVLLVLASVGVVSSVALPLVESLVPLLVVTLVVGSRLGYAPVSNAYMIAVLPDAVRGKAWGIIRTVFFLFGSLGSTVVGVMADAGYFDEAFFLLAAVSGVAALFYLRLPPRAAAIQARDA